MSHNHRIPQKITKFNAVYHSQISTLDPEIFTCKFEKCVKYANEKTDDIMDSTQYYIFKYLINKAISVIST